MTWGWNARGALPVDGTGLNTTGGGSVGGVSEAAKTAAWPRYEADYLKRALTSDRYKYDTEGMDSEQKAVYLDRIVANYQAEADECLKAEFEQWLEGRHECNDPSQEHLYENADGKPVRRWVFRNPEAMDDQGGWKVSQPRVGWKHTPWGRTPLTYLPGVRDYLRAQKEKAHEEDTKMQLLAEFGPQDIDQAWKYFKHWVKGRPLSDAVAIQPYYDEMPEERTIFNRIPNSLYAYDSEPSDRQPGVRASDSNAFDAAISKPGEAKVRVTTPGEDKNVQDVRALTDRAQHLLATLSLGPDNPTAEMKQREDAQKASDLMDIDEQVDAKRTEKGAQIVRQRELSGPTTLVPALA